MKKYLLAIVAVAATLVSCQKNDNPTPEKKGVPMTLKASINGNIGSKVTYTPGATSGLKVDWEATEHISVVTLNGSGYTVAIDDFVSTGVAGRTEATFTGTFTGGDNPTVIVIYPALEEYSAGNWGTKEYMSYNGYTDRLLYNMSVDGTDEYFTSRLYLFKQTADNNTSHLQNALLMVGAATLEGDTPKTLTTTLSNQLSIIKFKCTFDNSLKGKTINSIHIESYDASDNAKVVFQSTLPSWEYANIYAQPFALRGAAALHTIRLYADFAVPESGEATLYTPVLFTGNNVATDYWNITVEVAGADRPVITKTFTTDKTYERGKMYTVELAVN